MSAGVATPIGGSLGTATSLLVDSTCIPSSPCQTANACPPVLHPQGTTHGHSAVSEFMVRVGVAYPRRLPLLWLLIPILAHYATLSIHGKQAFTWDSGI